MSQEIPHSTPEQRSPLYDDVRRILATGYLTTGIRFDGHLVVLRSGLPSDHEILHWATEEERVDWILSRTITQIGRYPMSGEPEIVDYLQTLRPSLRRRLLACWGQLQTRADRAFERTFAYCFERESLHQWLQWGRQVPGDPQNLTGAQRVWMAFNQFEDQRIQHLQYWQGCKLIASAQDSKGVQQLNRQDQQRLQDEDDRRQFIMDQMYYQAFGILLEQRDFSVQGFTYDSIQGVYRAKTFENLEEQLRREIAGEEDWHDAAVRVWRESLAQQQQEEEAARRRGSVEHLGRDILSGRRVEEEAPAKPLPDPDEIPFELVNGRITPKKGFQPVVVQQSANRPTLDEDRRITMSDDGTIGG